MKKLRIKKVEPTFYWKFPRKANLYFRKVNQHKETMGWYNHIRNEIGIVNQYHWLRNTYIFIHEFIHYLNHSVSITIDKWLDKGSDIITKIIWRIK